MSEWTLTDSLDGLGRVWRWWVGEIRQIVPKTVAEFFDPDGSVLEVTLGRDRAKIRLLLSSEQSSLEDVDLLNASDTELDSYRNSNEELLAAGKQVEIKLEDDFVLRRLAYLPLEAEHSVKALLEYEIDRLAPFPPEEVCYGYRLSRRIPEHEKLEIEIFAVSRVLVKELVRRLKIIGLEPNRLVPDSASVEGSEYLNILPEEMCGARESLWDGEVKKASIVAFLLAALLAVLPLWWLSNETKRLHQKINEVRADAMILAEKRSAANIRQLAQHAIISRHLETPSRLQILSNLTQLLPEDSWVSELRIEGLDVTLSGQSGRASDLIGILESSESFVDVQFSSPITRDPSNSKDQYELEMRLVANSQ